MSLRRVTLLVVAVTFFGLVAFVTFTLESTLLRHFVQVEEQMVYLSVQRAVTAVDNVYDYLDSTAKGWAIRDDAYSFFQNGDSSFVNKNLSTTNFSDIKIDLVVLVKPDGEIVYQKAYSQEDNHDEPLPPELLSRLVPGDKLLQMLSNPAGGHGILQTAKGALLISMEPVTASGQDSAPAGKPVGALIVGRYMNAAEILRISSIIQLPLTMTPYNSASLSEDLLQARDLISKEHAFAAIPLNADQIGGFAVLNDIDGNPAYLLKTEQRRVIYQNGRMLTNYLVTAMYAAGFIFGLMTILLLEFLVLSRLTRLNSEVNQIGASGDVSKRVTVTRKDELSNLSENINGMLVTLEQAQIKRQELQEALSQRVDDLGALYDTSQVFLSQLDKATFLQNTCRLAVQRFDLDAAWIADLTPDGLWLQPVASHSNSPEPLELPQLSAIGTDDQNHPAVRAFETNARQVVNDISISPEANGLYGSLAAFPLFQDEVNFTALILCSRRPGFFTPEREQLLQAFANQSGMALHNAHLYEQVLAAQKRLEILSRRLVEVQEEERKWIAMELHDEIGQVLTGLKLSLPLSDPDEATAERLQKSKEMVTELIQRIRQLSLELRPGILDDLGLLPALLWHLENYTRHTGVEVHFQHANLENQRFQREIETTAYRVVQEALTNIARHAQVKEAGVRVWTVDESLMIEVEDQGAGFDPSHLFEDGASHGLLSVRERINFVGGRFNVTSSPGKGTCLEIQLPLAGSEGGIDYGNNDLAG